jgi:uncharacterized protein YlxW (UPF0749 family)
MTNDAFATNSGHPESSGDRHSELHHRQAKERFEQELLDFQKDESKMAREIILLRKEVNRLHYKVKTYQQKNYNLAIITTTLLLAVLSVIAYKVMSLP